MEGTLIRIYTENGNKMVQFLGYCYCAGISITENPEEVYRIVTYKNMVSELEKVINFDISKESKYKKEKGPGLCEYEIYFSEKEKQYIDDCIEKEAADFSKINDGEIVLSVDPNKITLDILDGCYFFEC